MMIKELTIIETDIKQSQLHIYKEFVKIKFPVSMSLEDKEYLKEKFKKIAEELIPCPVPLKAFYRLGSPYVFLNKTLEDGRKETVYTFELNLL